MKLSSRTSLVVLACVVLTGAARAQDTVDFNRKVLPILAKRCFHCHGPETQEAGLRLNSLEAATAKLESGETAVVPGKPDASELLRRLTAKDESERMPPEGEPLSAEQIELVRKWIATGAKWEKHWSFQPLTRPDVPAVKNTAWLRNPVDAFVLSRLEENELSPVGAAGKAALLRRLYFDVTGLPPSPDEVRDFLADHSPLAYEAAVDRLLASPHYGERWGRHWLDLVRFAETNSFERDGVKPNAWRFRDYVIRSFNNDLPYNEFIKEQLAGDELPRPSREQIIATGYYRLGLWDDEPADPLLAKYDGLDDVARTTGEVFLGLTIGCARCHDHKIDPIPQSDYYSFVAFFRGLTPYGTRGDQRSYSQWDITPPHITAEYQKLDARKRDIESEKRKIEQRGIVKMSAPDQRKTEGPKRQRDRVLAMKLKQHLSDADWNQYQELKQQLAAVEADYRKLPRREAALAVARVDRDPKDTFILMRGNPQSKGEKVEPTYPTILGGGAAKFQPPAGNRRSSGRRLALANWIGSEQNMATARVMANRLWQFHFGRGIVRSPNNFGLLGEPPTHPKLLDWLATELMRQNWSLKAMHRVLLTSNTYRMSSQPHEKGLAKDPANNLFWRFNMRRLSAEEIRDATNVVTGRFNTHMHGPGIYPKISQEVMQGQSRPGAGWGNSSPQQRARRSVYIHVKRSLITPLLSDFDFADTDSSCPVRFVTTPPTQALGLLNGEFVNEQATAFADRLRREVGFEVRDQVKHALGLALSREPTDDEINRKVNLVKSLQDEHNVPAAKALEYFCLVVLNLNEFVYVD